MTTRHFAHHMPFGADLQPDGTVRFRLWAPKQPSVAVVLENRGENRGETLVMDAAGDGWFAAVTDRAGPGTPYRFRLADGMLVPDPASRGQAQDVHGPSLVVDPHAYTWQHGDWRGRPWEEAVLYELHIGTFSGTGDFDGVRRKLDHLVRTGVTAVELMPIADFPGHRNWGYDGALLFAPDTAYGRPDQLKALIDEAHGRDLMVFLDVVYNHFGPEGNYLHLYAPQFFTERHHTPWGAAIDFRQRAVRDFFIHNTLYWLQEYRFDGLRFDAVHAIFDDNEPHILVELAKTVRGAIGAGRHIHLVLENDDNQARYLARDADNRPRYYEAQWNDDVHHVYHVLLTGEDGGYYTDYADITADRLAKALAEGYVYQGQPSRHRHGTPRGEASTHLPPTAFVNFLQNHDQIGNRAFGERLTRLAPPEAVYAALAALLLAPQIPLLFMGEETGETRPFQYFCDYCGDLAKAIRRGRRREFARFPEFADPAVRETIPDPTAESTFAASLLDWPEPLPPERRERLEQVERLLRLRRAEVVPRLAGLTGGGVQVQRWDAAGVTAVWTLPDGARLTLLANLTDLPGEGFIRPEGRLLYETSPGLAPEVAAGALPAWSVIWLIEETDAVDHSLTGSAL